MADATPKFQANFVRASSSPRSPLIVSTPAAVSRSLRRLYPFLLILDNILNNILWLTADSGTTFINLVLLLLSTRYLLTPKSLPNDYVGSVTIETYILDFAGALSSWFLLLSITYYITTLFDELKSQDPPTLDEILQVAGDINVKLRVLREESSAFRKIGSPGALLCCCLLTTPVQFILFRHKLVSSSRGYVLSLVLLSGCYHSEWFQGTLRLLHRIRPVRGSWFAVVRHLLSGTVLPRTPSVTSLLQHHISSKMETNDYWLLTVPAAEDFHGYINDIQHLRQLLAALIKTIDKVGESPLRDLDEAFKGLRFRVVELEICENERKQGDGLWLPSLLVYERYPFTIAPLEDPVVHPSTISSEDLPKSWFWLDDEWSKTDWIYCNTSWIPIGVFDSPECFKRFRVWRRRVFQKMPSKRTLQHPKKG